MPINFVSTAILAFLLGVMETCFIVHGLYLIFSKQTMVKNDFAPNQPLRRLGGYILLFLALSYIYTCRLIPQIPHWGEEGGDVWVPYLNRDTLLYTIIGFPAFMAFLFRMVEKLKLEQLLTLLVPTIVPIALFVIYCFYPSDIVYFSSLTFWVTYTVVMLILFVRKMIIYERRIEEQHSDLEHRYLWRFFYPAGLFIITMMIGLSLSFHRDSYILLSIYFIFNIISTISLVWAADNLEGDPVQEDTKDDDETNELAEIDEFTKKRFEAIEAALNKELKKRPFYLDSKLNINYLAHKVGTNRTYLGQYFRYKGTTFYSYINSLRIEHACKMIEEGNLIISEIAFDCGFNSLRTFRRVFYEQKGCSPSEWRGGGGG
ncbi:MAG: helix-turn-helix transcriptional regulator [Paludibacteraceae bacterium]|nr:helix-turn-helix transcriptional regulator [Paludibacteraceae bacterium]